MYVQVEDLTESIAVVVNYTDIRQKTQCWLNVGPASQTIEQHWANMVQCI